MTRKRAHRLSTAFMASILAISIFMGFSSSVYAEAEETEAAVSQQMETIDEALLAATHVLSEGKNEAEIKAYLDEAVDKSFPENDGLEKYINPVNGQDTNAIVVVEGMLQANGYNDINVSLKTPDTSEDHTVGVEADGTIHYLQLEPSELSTDMQMVQLQTVYTLEKDDVSEDYFILTEIAPAAAINQMSILGEAELDSEEEYVDGTFKVIGSDIIKKAEDHDSAHRDWYEVEFHVPAGTTLYELSNELLDRPAEGFAFGASGGFVTSITVPEQGTNTYQITNGLGSFWTWYSIDADGQPVVGLVGADQYEVQAGDVLVWEFTNDPEYPYDVLQEDPEEPVSLEPTPDHWTGFGKNNDNNAVYESDAVNAPDKDALWQAQLGERDEWGTSTNSDFLVIGEHLYVANGSTLYKLDKDGQTVATADLRTSMGYFARLAYDNGLIVVPLTGGALQAVRASDMKTIWVAESSKYINWEPIDPDDFTSEWKPVYYDVQNNSSTYVADGYAYTSTIAMRDWETAVGGLLRSVDMATGQTHWIREFQGGGFYWSGSVKVGDALIIGGEDGVLYAVSVDTGADLAAPLTIGAKIRSSIVHQGDYLYFTDTAGSFHQVGFDADSGSFGSHQSVKFAGYSTSTPTIYGNKAYVGSSEGFHVIDLGSMKVAANYATDGPVQATPLVVPNSKGGVSVFFTVNHASGEMLVYDGQSVSVAFAPPAESQNYTTSSVVVSKDGTLFYTNDSGAIFALASGKEEPTIPSETETAESVESGKTQPAEDETSRPTERPDDSVIPQTGLSESYHLTGMGSLLILAAIVIWLTKRRVIKE